MATNYLAQLPVADPTQSFLGGLQLGNAVQKVQAANRANERETLIQESFAKLRQPGATAADYANLSMLLPEDQAKSVRESFKLMDEERQKVALNESGKVFSALRAGQPQVAIEILDRQIEAKRNSGDEEGAKFLTTWRDVAKQNPQATEDYFGFTIAQIPGGDKVIDGAIKLPKERREADIAKAETRIKAMEAQLKREDNQLKREELQLKIADAQTKRDELDRSRVADAQDAGAKIDNLLNSVDEALKVAVVSRDKSGKPMGFSSVVSAATGPVSSRVPTVSQDVADFEEMINTLGSQVMLSRVAEMRGTGALSDKEGEALRTSLQSLSLRQSPQKLVSSLEEINRLMSAAKGRMAKKYGVALEDTRPGAEKKETRTAEAQPPAAPAAPAAPDAGRLQALRQELERRRSVGKTTR